MIVLLLVCDYSHREMVDTARMPMYLVTEAHKLGAVWADVLLGSAGVVAGTIVGQRVLAKIPQNAFRSVISLIILALGTKLLIDPHL